MVSRIFFNFFSKFLSENFSACAIQSSCIFFNFFSSRFLRKFERFSEEFSVSKNPVFLWIIVSRYHHSLGAITGIPADIDSIATIPKSSFLLIQIVAVACATISDKSEFSLRESQKIFGNFSLWKIIFCSCVGSIPDIFWKFSRSLSSVPKIIKSFLLGFSENAEIILSIHFVAFTRAKEM